VFVEGRPQTPSAAAIQLSRARWPGEVWPQPCIYRSAISRLGVSLRFIPEGMVGRTGKLANVVPHDVWNGNADAMLFVVQHQDRIAFGTKADLQRTARIVGVERHALDFLGVVDFQVTVVEEGHLRGVLPGYGFANVAMAFMVVDGLGGGGDMHVRASAGVLCDHNLELPEATPWSGGQQQA
jgi:hypothetical protein